MQMIDNALMKHRIKPNAHAAGGIDCLKASGLHHKTNVPTSPIQVDYEC